MANHSACAIANAFVDIGGVYMPQMKLQKLAYIAHGWNLAISDEPLIGETVQAWDGGPVFRSMWNAIRDYGTRDGKIVGPGQKEISELLSDSERAVISHVWKKYGAYSATELSAMTHRPNTPWSKAYFARGRDAPIFNADIADHYKELAFAGRK